MFVFSNLAVSLDGKIATANRGHFPIGSPEDRLQMHRLRKQCDAVLFGASTLRAFRKPCIVKDPSWAKRQPMNVIMSSKLEGISPKWPFFTAPGFRRILLVGPDVKKARLKAFDSSCEIFVLRKPTRARSCARQAIQILSAIGVQRLLVEGGGNIMADFVADDLIDEYHLTLVPKLIGGTEAPTLVDGPGFKPKDVLNLKLVQSRTLGDELFLIYRKTGKRG
jgi:5-amino-6-(5-phosphoribosylamino)uracil reductase